MSGLIRILLFITLSSFAFNSTAAAMLCDITDMDSTQTHDNAIDNKMEGCHDSEPEQSADESLNDCCHDMSLCHASSVLSGNETLTQVYINHFTIQKSENDHLVINSTSPPDRPPKHIA